jgi:hypothetical protein
MRTGHSTELRYWNINAEWAFPFLHLQLILTIENRVQEAGWALPWPFLYIPTRTKNSVHRSWKNLKTRKYLATNL